jgi:molybdate transport system substrate-binding protein
MRRRLATVGLTVVTLLTLGACGKDDSPAAVSGTVTVFAAGLAGRPFTQLGMDFEAAHPGVKVVCNFAGSSALAQQINQGAPAEVFASAATKNMD